MPAALERKLKREVSDKDWSEKKKDAYIYGTLRKTGWKPNREKKMSNPSKLIRLNEVEQKLDSIIQFDYGNDDQNKRSALGTAGVVGAGTAAGVGGTLAHQAISSSGGYAKNWATGVGGFQRGLAGKGMQGLGRTFGRNVGQQLGQALNKIKTLWKFSSNDQTVKFDSNLLEPFSAGAVPNSKIIEEQFPAGLSPAAVLRFPFPQLMAFLKQRNILQQQFSKREKLIALGSKVDAIIRS